jgi:hypothetical protein
MKKTTKSMLVLAVAFAGLVGASSVLAQHRHHHGARISIGFGFGVPFAAYPYYYPPYYAPYYPAYYPAPVVVQQQPTVYVEQQPAPSAQPSAPAGYWYYCGGSRAYYPYVKECPGGWQRVAPQPG